MKKLIASLLVLMLLPFSAALAETESAAGTWYFTQLTYADYTTTATDSGLDMMLVLAENGDASSVTISGLTERETSGVWSQDGDSLSITLDGKERAGVISDGCIILGSEGEQILTFSRTAPMGVYYTPAEPSDAAIADYIGAWECTYASIGTRIMALSAIDSAAEITVTGILANVYIRNTADDETSATFPIALDGGKLLLGSADAPAYTLQLLQDGVVKCDMGTGVVYYFQPAADAEHTH